MRYKALAQSDHLQESSDDEIFDLDEDQLEFDDQPIEDEYPFDSKSLTKKMKQLPVAEDSRNLIRHDLLTAGLGDSIDAETWDQDLKETFDDINRTSAKDAAKWGV